MREQRQSCCWPWARTIKSIEAHAEPNAAPDRGGITAFRTSTSHQPPRHAWTRVNGMVGRLHCGGVGVAMMRQNQRMQASGAVRPMADKPQYPPTLELDGARLRPLRVADAAALYAYLRDPVVTELTSYPVASVPMVEGMIERSLSRWAAGEVSRWGVALQHDDQLVGTCGFNEWSQVHRWAELAFDLAQAHWGKGLMRQAVAAVLQWTFRQNQVDRVHAFVRVDNGRSERLLERSGFVREGCLRSYRVCRGQPHDFYVYGLLRSDWTAAQQPVGVDEARR